MIFDLWETLGTKNIGVSSALREHFNIELTPEFLKKYEIAVQLEQWKSKDDMASSLLRAFSVPINEDNTRFVINLFDQAIERSTLFPGMLELLQALHKKYKIGLLSNTTIFEAVVSKKLGLTQLLDAEVYSWQIHFLKPSRRNFEEISTRLNVRPDDCLFIDDDKKNVVAAQHFGMDGCVFSGIENLKKTLGEKGISAS